MLLFRKNTCAIGCTIVTTVTSLMFLTNVVPAASQGIFDFGFPQPYPPGEEIRGINYRYSEILRSDSMWRVLGTPGSEARLDRQEVLMKMHTMFPTDVFSRGTGQPDVINSEIDQDIENIMITAYNYSSGPVLPIETVELSFMEALIESNTDGFIIMKDGVIVYEYYFGNFKPTSRHHLFSCTKSYLGVIAAELIEKQLIDEKAFISDLVPAFNTTEGLQGLTVRHLLDMTTDIRHDEDSLKGCGLDKWPFEIRESIMANPEQVGIDLPIPEGCEAAAYFASTCPISSDPEFNYLMSDKNYARWPGPRSLRDYVASVKKDTTETPSIGTKFIYKSVITDTLATLVEQVLQENMGMSAVQYFEEKFWSKIGAQADGMIVTDATRYAWWGGGSMATLRDFAKFGEMLLNYGQNSKGEQVVSRSIVEDLKAGGTPENLEQFRNSKYKTENAFVGAFSFPGAIVMQDYLDAIGEPNGAKGWVYHNQFWILADHVIMQRGIHGQSVWIDYDANVVMAKVSSNPTTFEDAGYSSPMFFDLSTYFQQKSNPTKSSKKALKKEKLSKKGK